MATKVLVVDDSLTMRALISSALEKIPGIKVVGTAESADEARLEVERLSPDVMTLDVEMPGMSGLEYLAEVMLHRPMPVIMFSARTDAGAEASIEALRLGAIDCFPKPKVATQDEFGKLLTLIAKRLKTARSMPNERVASVAAPVARDFRWNGRLLAIGSDEGGTQALFDLLGSLSEDCPPTVVVQHLRPELLDAFAAKLKDLVRPRVMLAEDRMPVEQGCIYLTRSDEYHMIVDKWPEGSLRVLHRDPLAGHRPSISLLFASLCAAKAEAVGLLLSPTGEDGVSGLKAMLRAGCYVVAPSGLLDDSAADGAFRLHKGEAGQALPRDKLVKLLVKLCSK